MAIKKISNTKNNREENRNSFKNQFVFALIHELQFGMKKIKQMDK